METDNKVIGRYSVGARTLLVLCPFCGHNSHIVFSEDSLFKAKDYLGSFTCYGGRNPETGEQEDCGEELWVTEIR